MAERFEVERDVDTSRVEVVVLNGPSLEVIHRTHSRYFAEVRSAARLRMVLDKKLGRDTPEKVLRLAASDVSDLQPEESKP